MSRSSDPRPRHASGVTSVCDEKEVFGLLGGEPPAPLTGLGDEVSWPPEPFHDLEFAPVVQAARSPMGVDIEGAVHGSRRLVVDVVAGSRPLRGHVGVGTVEYEHPAVGREDSIDQSPEVIESFIGHMGQPEAHHDHVEASGRFPVEEVGHDVVDVLGLPKLVPTDLERLGRTVERSDVIRVAREVLGPVSGARGELEDVAGRSEVVECGDQLRDLR